MCVYYGASGESSMSIWHRRIHHIKLYIYLTKFNFKFHSWCTRWKSDHSNLWTLRTPLYECFDCPLSSVFLLSELLFIILCACWVSSALTLIRAHNFPGLELTHLPPYPSHKNTPCFSELTSIICSCGFLLGGLWFTVWFSSMGGVWERLIRWRKMKVRTGNRPELLTHC